MSTLPVSELLKVSFRLKKKDVVDPYSYMGLYYDLSNYRLFTMQSLIQLAGKASLLPAYLKTFIIDEKLVVGIVNHFQDKDFYIIFRSLINKKFITYGNYREFPYGIFSLDKKFTPQTPIVLVEGLKDRDTLGKIYPYVFALQSTGLSSMGREILKTLTNKVILLLDNDEQGKKGSKREYYKLQKYFDVSIADHPDGIKDVGTLTDYRYFGKSYEADYLEEYYKTQLSILGCNI